MHPNLNGHIWLCKNSKIEGCRYVSKHDLFLLNFGPVELIFSRPTYILGIFHICVYFIHTYFKNKKVYKEMDFLSSYGNHESFGSQSH